MVDLREMPFHLKEHPERFSPDAILRPVVQSSIFPTVAYVAGPGEVAYYAQLKEVHKTFGVPFPVIYPRASATLIEGGIARSMEKFGLDPTQIFSDTESRPDLLASSGKDDSLSSSMGNLLDETEKKLVEVEGKVSEIDRGVGRVVKKIRGRITRDLAYMDRRVTAALEEFAGVGERQLNRLFGNTFPKGLPQERVFNILYFLVKYGPELPHDLILNLQGDPRQHLIYSLNAFTNIPVAEESADGSNDGAEANTNACDLAGEDDLEKEGASRRGVALPMNIPDITVDLLGIGAHPDDIEIACGGLVLNVTTRGGTVAVVDLSSGEGGTSGSGKIRIQEAKKAAAVLGLVARETLGLPDCGIQDNDDQRRALAESIRKYRPRILLAPYPRDDHPDHAAAGAPGRLSKFSRRRRGGMMLLEPATVPAPYFFYMMHHRFTPDFIVDVSDVYEKKLEAIRCYASQLHRAGSKENETNISSPDFLDRIAARHRFHGDIIGAKYGEGMAAQHPPGLVDIRDLKTR